MVRNKPNVNTEQEVVDLTEDSDYYTSSYIKYFTWIPSFSNSNEKKINIQNGVLYVMFKSSSSDKSNSIYLYENTDISVYRNLKKKCDPEYDTKGEQTAGQYFANHIKPKYSVEERFDETEDYVVMVQD